MKHRLAPLAVALVALAAAVPPASAQTKKELVARVMLLQQPGVEALAKSIAEQPAIQLTMSARGAFQNVPAERRDAVAKAIDAELKKYTDEAVPLLRERALKLAPTAIGSEIETNFSEDELKQLIQWLESPVIKRYQQIAPGMQRTLADKLVADTRGQIEPKLKTLESAMARHLGLPPPGSQPGPGGANGAGAAPGPGPGTAAPLPGNRGGGEPPRK